MVPFGGLGGGVLLRPLGAQPKIDNSGKVKAWDWNRWSSNGYTNYNEKVLLFGDLDPNPKSQDPNDPTVGYRNGFEIQIGDLGRPRHIKDYEVPHEVRSNTNGSLLVQISGPFYSSELLKRVCNDAFGNRFLLIHSNGVNGDHNKRGYLKNFTCQGCKATSGSSCKFRLQYEVLIDGEKKNMKT